jgi:hypothetical protein
MVSYEKKVTKVVDFRKMTGQKSYEEELRERFSREIYLRKLFFGVDPFG